jgi:hypothetical protein
MSLPLTPTKEILEVMLSLEHHGAFIKFLDFLKKRAEGIGVDFALIRDEAELRQVQGQAFEIHEILHLFHKRSEAFARITAVHEDKGRVVL